MSVYNESEKILRMAIDSILNQSYDDFEFIIILDNPDNHIIKNVLLEYKKIDGRINLIFNKHNLGLANALNIGLNHAKGEYIARMDADDISSHNRLKIQKDYLDKNDSISVVSGNNVYIDENNNVIKNNISLKSANYDIVKIMSIKNVIIHPCVMFRKNDILKVGGYRCIPAIEDYDLWTRLLANGYQIGIIDKCLLKYRVRNDGISCKNILCQRMLSKYLRNCIKYRMIPNERTLLSLAANIKQHKIDNFNRSMMYYNKLWDYYHDHNYFLAFLFFCKSIIYDGDIINIFFEELKINYLLKKEKL